MKKLLFFLKILIGIIILILLIYKVGTDKILFTIKQVKTPHIITVMLLHLVSLFIGALNIKILTTPYKHKPPILKLFKYYLLSFSLGLLSPGRLGDMSLIYFLKKERISIGKGSAVFVLDKLITVTIVSIISITGFLTFFTISQTLKIYLLLIFILLICTFMLFTEKGRSIIKKYILRTYSKKFRGFSKSIHNYLKDYKKEILLNYTITFARILIDALMIYLLFISLGVVLPFLWVVIARAIIVVIALIPLTPNGLGIKESAAVFLFSKLNVNAEITTTVFIFILILVYLTAAISITSLLKKEYLGIKENL